MSSLWCSLRKLSGLCELCLTLDCLRHSIISLINSSVENVFGKMKSVQPIPCQWLFVMGFACKNYHYTFYESVVKCEDVTQHCKYHFAKLVLENIRIFQVDLSWRYDLKSFQPLFAKPGALFPLLQMAHIKVNCPTPLYLGLNHFHTQCSKGTL